MTFHMTFEEDGGSTTQSPSQYHTACGPIGYEERERQYAYMFVLTQWLCVWLFCKFSTYELIVCQQPLHEHHVWIGWKGSSTHWSTTHCAISDLTKNDRPGEGYAWVDLQSLQTTFFALHVTLWSADGTEEPISFPIHLNVLVCLWIHLSAHQVF